MVRSPRRRSCAANRSRAWVVAGLWALCLPAVAGAQAGSDNGNAVAVPGVRPQAEATRVEEAPLIDGDVLNDPVWREVAPISGFWQTTPDEGRPASERTEVRVVFTESTIYFGIVCYDSNPAGIVVSDTRRDSPLDETDSLQIILDTYRDGQNGFVFGTNPAGMEYDGQVSNEGQGGGGGARQQTGSGGGFNLNWDGAWQVRTRIFEQGWSAEFAIPFKTLRYRPGETSWGFNVQRNIRRRNERAFWARLDRQYSLYRLSEAGVLTGLALPVPRNLKLMPYVLGAAVSQRHDDRGARLDPDLGVDVKYGVTPSLTLDFTVNTDFAQVEVDEEQVNLDRFNLFFPEKRPFFLENAGLFSVGNPGEVEMFFSRRIGIGNDGRVIPIVAGGRLTGKASGFNVGLLNMQTSEDEGFTPAQNFTAVRVNREFGNRSRVGGLFVNRMATGGSRRDDDNNQTVAVDARFGIGRRGQVRGYAASTRTPGIRSDAYAYSVGSQYESERWRLSADYTEVGDGFNPEVGFLSRRGFRKPDLLAFRTIRLPENRLGLFELRPHVSYRGFWNHEGFQETGYLHVDNHYEWRSAHEVHTGVNFTREGVVRPFTIYPGVVVPAGTYDHKEAQIVGFTNRGHWIYVDSTNRIGGFFGGTRFSTNTGIVVRPGETFNASVYWNRNDVNLPWGDFVTNLVRTRVSYSFSPRVYLQALLQYNDRAEIWSTNLRFGWLSDSNTGLFVVYNDVQDLDDRSTRQLGRSLTIKFSRLIDVLR